MGIGELIKRERERLGWSMTKLAARSGISKGQISKIERGLQIGHADTITRLTRALGIDPAVSEAAMSESQGIEAAPEPTPEDIARQLLARLERQPKAIMVRVVQSFGAAGEGAVAEVEEWPYIPTPEEMGHDIIGMWVKGDCLSPRVRDGERILIDRNAEPRDGDVLAVLFDGESLLRILQDGELVALNRHPPIPFDDERVHLEGVVVFTGRRP